MKKILTRLALLRRLSARRARGEHIVFTNGCFDVLHAGHVQTLAFAKAQGDVLVVGVNSDRSVRRLKGPTRPVNRLADRVIVLAAVAAVDHVVVFGEDTPERLIRQIKPDVLVKGADWRGRRVAGQEWAEWLVFAPLLPGRSTTRIQTAIEEAAVKRGI